MLFQYLEWGKKWDFMESRAKIMYIKICTKFSKAILPSKQENEGRQILMEAFKWAIRVFFYTRQLKWSVDWMDFCRVDSVGSDSCHINPLRNNQVCLLPGYTRPTCVAKRALFSSLLLTSFQRSFQLSLPLEEKVITEQDPFQAIPPNFGEVIGLRESTQGM